MPSDKKRINLTVSDEIYEQLQEFKQKNGISNDAGACLQLITKQLKAQREMESMLEIVKKFSIDDLQQFSSEGLAIVKRAADEM